LTFPRGFTPGYKDITPIGVWIYSNCHSNVFLFLGRLSSPVMNFRAIY
jgi:hypothetical protein